MSRWIALLLVCGTIGAAGEARRIPYGARVWIDRKNETGNELARALVARNVPLVIVAELKDADYRMGGGGPIAYTERSYEIGLSGRIYPKNKIKSQFSISMYSMKDSREPGFHCTLDVKSAAEGVEKCISRLKKAIRKN